MIETVAIVVLFCILAVAFFKAGQKAGKDKAEADMALRAADEALNREPVALIIAWPADDPNLDIPRDYKRRGQA